jgi:hypothetical protein
MRHPSRSEGSLQFCDDCPNSTAHWIFATSVHQGREAFPADSCSLMDVQAELRNRQTANADAKAQTKKPVSPYLIVRRNSFLESEGKSLNFTSRSVVVRNECVDGQRRNAIFINSVIRQFVSNNESFCTCH